METKKLCAYNLTRESFLSMGLTTVDTAMDPLTVLRVLVEGLELNSDSGFWLTSLTGIPGVPRISPFDLAYLNDEKHVVQCIELLPGKEFPTFERHVVSALVMPLHTFSSTQTRTGDRLLICWEEEMMHHLAQISRRNGDSAFRVNGLAAEQPPARTAIPDPLPIPTQSTLVDGMFEQKSPVPADAETPAQIASVAASPAPLGREKSEAERARGPRDVPPSAPETPPNRVPGDANGHSKGFRRTPGSQFLVPAAGLSMPRNIEFTVAQAPIWRVSGPVVSTSEADVRKLAAKESQPAHAANGLTTSKDKGVGTGKIVRPPAAAANGSEPAVTSQPIAVPSAAVPPDPAPSIVFTSVAKTETSWVRDPLKPNIPPATHPIERVQDTEHLIETKRADEPIARALPAGHAQSKITTPKRPGASRRRNAMMTIQFPRWLQLDFMKNPIQRFRHWFNAEPPVSDRRRSDRRQVPGLVAYYWTGGAPIEHKIADISETGFYLITEDRWIKETMLQMTLQRTPAKDGRPRQSLAVLTKVVRRGRDGVGHEFVMKESLDHDTREALPARGTDKLALGRFL